MDPLDDFEFKPLTEGLGFHQKAKEARPKAEPKPARTEQEKLSRASIMDTPATRASSLLDDDDDDLGLTTTDRHASSNLNSSSNSMSNYGGGSLSGGLGGGVESSPSKSISDLIASLPPSLDFTESIKEDPVETPRPQIFQPLAREDYKSSFEKPSFEKPSFEKSKFEAPRPSPTLGQVLPPPGSKATSPTSATVAAPLVGGTAKPTPSPYRASMDESLARAFPHAVARAPEAATTTATEKKKSAGVENGLEPVPVSFGAGLLDAMVVTGMSMVLLVIILAITKANLWGLLSNAQTDGPTQLHLVLLFLAVLQLYMLTARSFFGASLGEWAFDLQLGTNQEQVTALYPIKVAWRTLVMTATGLVVIPIASLIARRDLGRYVTGLQLYRRP